MEAIKEQIRYYRKLLKMLWLTAIVISFGLAYIVASPSSFEKSSTVFLVFVFAVLLFVCVLTIIKLYRNIMRLLDRLEQEG